jgi:hypothetical protein
MNGTSQKDCIPQLQKGLNMLYKALHDIGLHIHPTKITNMIFSTKRKDISTVHRYYYEDRVIPTKQLMEYLGLFIDAKLTWKHHIIHLLNKCNKRIAVSRKVVKTPWGSNHIEVRMLYTSLIRSVMEYGSTLYDSATKRYLDKLDAMQHTCLHIIMNVFPPVWWGIRSRTSNSTINSKNNTISLQLPHRQENSKYKHNLSKNSTGSNNRSNGMQVPKLEQLGNDKSSNRNNEN